VTDIYRGSLVQRNFWMVAHYSWMTLYPHEQQDKPARRVRAIHGF